MGGTKAAVSETKDAEGGAGRPAAISIRPLDKKETTSASQGTSN